MPLRQIKFVNLQYNAFASYVYADVKSNGKHVLIDHIYVAPDGNTYFPLYIEMSSFILRIKIPFMYLVSILIHEMIHQYTVEFGNEIQLKYDDQKKRKKHNPHKNEFMKMMNEINEKYGTSISEISDINNIKAEFDRSIEAARKMLESDNKNDDIVYQNEYMIVEKLGEEDIYVTHLF